MSFANSIFTEAKNHQLNPQLIAAVICQESAGSIWAVRQEPAFSKKYLDNKSEEQLGGYWPMGSAAKKTERALRGMSFGLMQIMGQVARELGYEAIYLAQLLLPADNIAMGSLLLSRLLEKTGSTTEALLGYNGGGDKDYPTKVLAHIDSGDCQAYLRA